MSRTKLDIFVEKTVNGGVILSTVEGNQRIHKTYFGFALAEAKKNFRQYVKERLKG